MATQEKVVAGPGKFDLMLALFNKGSEVHFTFKGDEPRAAVVQSVEAEDVSRESWNLVIRFTAGSGKLLPLYYDTRTRTGVITWSKEKSRVPQNGDRVTTIFHGVTYTGILKNVCEPQPDWFLGELHSPDGRYLAGQEHIKLNRPDGKFVWDELRKMWSAPAG